MSDKSAFYAEKALETTYSTWATSAVLAGLMTVGVLTAAVTVGPLSNYTDNVVQHLVHEHKEVISSTPLLPSASSLKLSKKSREDVYDLLDTTPEKVLGIVVSEIDFTKNSFAPVFVASNESRTQDEWDKRERLDVPIHYPLFTDSADTNDRILNLLDGRVDCRHFNELVGYDVFLPETNTKWTCAVAVPPTAHKKGKSFGGFMTVMFQSRMGYHEEQKVMEAAKKTASAIYERDVKQ